MNEEKIYEEFKNIMRLIDNTDLHQTQLVSIVSLCLDNAYNDGWHQGSLDESGGAL